MFSTLYLFIFIGFQFWYWTSKQVKHPPRAVLYMRQHPALYRWVGGLLLAVTNALFIIRLGWMNGISTWLVGVMGVGSLMITLAPFHALRIPTVGIIYLVCLLFELFI